MTDYSDYREWVEVKDWESQAYGVTTGRVTESD